MNDLESSRLTHRQVLEMSSELIENALRNSKGQEDMSIKDVKLCILGLKGIVEHQGTLIETLYDHLNMKSKKSFWTKFFKK
jgi:hypothetical protein